MSYIALDGALAQLTGAVSIGATSIPVTTGKGALFEVGSNHSYVTFESATETETVKITGRSGDSLTVLATTKAWNIGAIIECRPCAQAMADYAAGPQIDGSAAKTTPVDADKMGLIDSAASNVLKKITWANIKATLASTFAALAGSVSQAFTAASIELGHASDTTLTRVSAGVVAVEGNTVALDGSTRIQTCWIPAGAMVARTTNGAAPGTVETATNKNMIKTMDFDATTAEYAQFSINMPKSWDEGTVTAVFVWSHAATTTDFGVAWGLAGVAVSDDDAMDVAFGTAGTVTDTGGTTNDCYITAASSAITIAGTPAANDLVMFQVKRDPANGSDTMAIDARLHGVRLMYSINTLTDA